MVSILIPTYNADCVPLAEKLRKMAERAAVPYEIIVADDASFEGFRERNAYIATWPKCRYLQMDHNVGPARLRNYLADNAQYSYLLFMDSDVMPANDDFLELYIRAAKPYSVVCGGFRYPDTPSHGAELRHRFGVEREAKSVNARRAAPYKDFNSMNFMIYRETFQQIRFDDTFHLGYEDTMFGIRLQQAHVEMIHADIPAIHVVEEKTDAYLRKVERAVRILKGHETEMLPYVKLLHTYSRLKRLGLEGTIAALFRLFRPLIVCNLTSRHPSLKLFSLFKLGTICQ
jgi:glycosyltransferase involved in cell wall biosynthesis